MPKCQLTFTAQLAQIDKEGDEQTAAAWPRKRKGTKSGQKNPRGIRKKTGKKSDGVSHENSENGKSEGSSAIQDTQNDNNLVEQSSEAPDRNEEDCSSQKIQEFVVETLSGDHLLLLTLANSGVHESSGDDGQIHSTACPEPVLSTLPAPEGDVVEANGREESINNEDVVTISAGTSEELPDETLINSGKFKCPQCNKCLSGPSSLSRHIRTHKNEKPFKCDQCDKVFSRRTMDKFILCSSEEFNEYLLLREALALFPPQSEYPEEICATVYNQAYPVHVVNRPWQEDLSVPLKVKPNPLACQPFRHRTYSEKPPGPAQISAKPRTKWISDFNSCTNLLNLNAGCTID
ncbi:hypothetical protein pdam_00000654 [Pocillopora damicornis]|uniref:C2H2-type domain-containing protein n=1 Tax=Pocillopora damicornis TaxID=46731 RepID=A0A3M6TYE1_POCDA|nr:hypothetical protein pdam_00000654 [Pocillopora damicornis]